MEPPHHVGLREDLVGLRPYSTPQEVYKRKDTEFIWSITSHQVRILPLLGRSAEICLLGSSAK